MPAFFFTYVGQTHGVLLGDGAVVEVCRGRLEARDGDQDDDHEALLKHLLRHPRWLLLFKTMPEVLQEKELRWRRIQLSCHCALRKNLEHDRFFQV